MPIWHDAGIKTAGVERNEVTLNDSDPTLRNSTKWYPDQWQSFGTETHLREREAHLYRVFQAIPDGIVILNPDGHIVAANAAAERLLGLTRSPLPDRLYNDLSWPVTSIEGTPSSDEALPFVSVMKTGQPVYGVEHAITHPDGTSVVLSINASPFFNPEGQMISVITTLSDITERKRTEETLRRSEERYRSVIEAAAEGIVLQDADGTIFTCNASAERILGLTAEQMMGRTSFDARWRAVRVDGSPLPGECHPAIVTLQTGEPQSNVIMGVHKPDGSLTWISVNTRPLCHPHEAKPYAVVASFFDITERRQTDEALSKTEQRYRSVLDSVKDVIFQTDVAGHWTFLNLAWTEITGFLVAESIGTSVLDYLHPGDRPHQMEVFQSLMRGETQVCHYETRYLTKTGDYRWIEATVRSTVDADHVIVGTSGTLNDITERKQAEEERAQLMREQAARTLAETAQQQAAFLAEVSAVLSSSLDYEQTLQHVANLAVPYFADWCSVDLLNDDQSIRRVAVAHQDPDKVTFAWQLSQRYPRHLEDGYGIARVMKTGQIDLEREISDEQLVAVIQDAEYLQIVRALGLKSCIIAPLEVQGRILGSISFVFAESDRRYGSMDVSLADNLARRAAIAIDNARLYRETQHARAEAERAASRTARLQQVTAALSEPLTPSQVAEVIVEQGMAALNAEYALIALLNDERTELKIAQASGYQSDLPDTWRTFSINAPVPLAEAVRTGSPIWPETTEHRIARYPHLEEEYKHVNLGAWISIPLLIKGRAIGGLSLSFREVPQLNDDDRAFILALAQQSAQAIDRGRLYELERKARAEAEAANQVKDQFLAIVSHELRTPLNSILGWAQILRSRQLDATTTARALETIERNARSQNQLIDDLLDVSRILRGKLQLRLCPIDLTSVITGAIESISPTADAKHIQLVVQLDASTGFISGDPERLQQIVWNLLSNAIKFTPEQGQVTVVLRNQGSQAQIQVSDTGIGISEEFLPNIFDYFRQADGSITRAHGGLGLGLAIVRNLVERHGGTVSAESPGVGQGATFTVLLPLILSPEETVVGDRATVPKSDLPLHAGQLQGLRILVVDDEKDTREFLTFTLEKAGALVTATASAEAALEVLPTTRPDLVISDIGMPEIDGYELIQRIRRLELEGGTQLPAIALTAYAGEDYAKQAIAAGFQTYLSKPIEVKDLMQRVLDLVER